MVKCQGYGRTRFNRDDNAFHRHTKLLRRSFDYAKIHLVWNEPINITYITIQIGVCLAGDFVECNDSTFENSIAIHFDKGITCPSLIVSLRHSTANVQ